MPPHVRGVHDVGAELLRSVEVSHPVQIPRPIGRPVDVHVNLVGAEELAEHFRHC
jgi:hypothetical protein